MENLELNLYADFPFLFHSAETRRTIAHVTSDLTDSNYLCCSYLSINMNNIDKNMTLKTSCSRRAVCNMSFISLILGGTFSGIFPDLVLTNTLEVFISLVSITLPDWLISTTVQGLCCILENKMAHYPDDFDSEMELTSLSVIRTVERWVYSWTFRRQFFTSPLEYPSQNEGELSPSEL